MFNTETLFILGAGASNPYGYPLGKKLIQNILDDMDDVIFIPRYRSNQTPPYWNENDIKKDHFYDFSMCVDGFKPILEHVDSSEQNQYSPCNDNGAFQLYLKQNKTNNYTPYNLYKTTIKQINIFHELKIALEIFDPISIDTFLRDNPSYAQAGKIMILYSLLKREDPSSFNISQSNDNWYSLLLNDLISECADNPRKLTDNKVKFTTFNYDVSLDFYLFSRLSKVEIFIKNTTDQNESLAKEFLNNLKINHVYGKLYSEINIDTYGKYFDCLDQANKLTNINVSWYGERSGPAPLPPTSLNLIQNFKRFIFSMNQFNNIKTMYDERNGSAERTEMISTFKADLEWAKEIIFIGFGFDRDNLNMLGIPDTLWEFNKIFPGKTIRYLNYNGNMKSLAQEFEKLQNECRDFVSFDPVTYGNKTVNIIQSTADSIVSAYLNDFKKYLLR